MKFANEEHRENTARQLAAGVRVFNSRGRELTMSDVTPAKSAKHPNKLPQKQVPASFAEAISQEMRDGADARTAIRAAAKRHPESYQAYLSELRNPPMAKPAPEDLAPQKSGTGTSGRSFGAAILQGVKSGLSDEDAVTRAMEQDPAAYNEYLKTLRPPEGANV
jgi:hypothetical protein